MSNKVNFAQAISLGFKNYVQFRGVASRSEYWYFALFAFLVSLVLSTIDSVITGLAGVTLPVTFSNIASIALFLPQLAIQVRRFRDASFSPWLILIQLVPTALVIAGAINLLASPALQQLLVIAEQGADPTTEQLKQLLDSLPPGGIAMFGAGVALALVWGIFSLVIECLPSKNREQGNKLAAE